MTLHTVQHATSNACALNARGDIISRIALAVCTVAIAVGYARVKQVAKPAEVTLAVLFIYLQLQVSATTALMDVRNARTLKSAHPARVGLF